MPSHIPHVICHYSSGNSISAQLNSVQLPVNISLGTLVMYCIALFMLQYYRQSHLICLSLSHVDQLGKKSIVKKKWWWWRWIEILAGVVSTKMYPYVAVHSGSLRSFRLNLQGSSRPMLGTYWAELRNNTEQ